MKSKPLYILALIIFFTQSIYGEHKTYNLAEGSLLKNVSVADVLKNSYTLGEWDIDNKVKKYKDDNNELYLLQENIALYPDAALVIPAKNIEGFIESLQRMKEALIQSMDINNLEFNKRKTYSIPVDSGLYEYISIDKKGITYEYGTYTEEINFVNNVDNPFFIMSFRVGKAPKFPYLKSGKQTYIPFYSLNRLESLINILVESTRKDKKGLNPDSIQRIGSYTDKGLFRTTQREILRYGTGITTKYYINIGDNYVDTDKYSEYLWFKGHYLPAFKKWLNDIFTEYYQVSMVLPSDNHIYKEFKIPDNFVFGGAVTGRFDIEMKIIDGFQINEDNTSITLFYSKEANQYWLSFKFGDYFISFLTPQQFKNFMNAFGK